ncbi:hypothetical protein URH17368_2523 [Alicyclobacillus hesperidum URH17-3-68]|nr:hypothetical protein URH17368_2523 [Alicyclobacillus hesperidum URH17-3-68]
MTVVKQSLACVTNSVWHTMQNCNSDGILQRLQRFALFGNGFLP